MQALPDLTTANAIAMSGALPFRRGGSEAGLPQRVKILSWGENLGRTTGAKIIVGEKSVEALPMYHAALGLDTTLLDYEHQSHPDHPNYLPDPRPVPGHGQIEIVPNDGVYLSGLTYTPNGQEHAANYADVSAVAHLDDDGNLLYVSSVALTQYGDVAGLPFADHVAALSARHGKPLSTTTTPPKKMETPDYREMLIKTLGLEPDESGEVTDESIAAALTAKSETPPATDEAALAAKAKPEAKPAADAENVVSMSAINARFDERDRQDIVKEATAAGKVIPLSNETIKTLTPAALRELVEKLPAGQVALSTESKAKGEKPSEKTVALTANHKAVAKSLGLTEEAYAASLAAISPQA